MKHQVIDRKEMHGAVLRLGGQPIDLGEYATTGLTGMAVGPRGSCKTNAALLIAEQLSAQGWVSVLVDPENELESLYGDAVANPAALAERLKKRDQPIVVVAAEDAEAFVPYGEVILAAADRYRKPLFVFIDEGQVFSAARRRKDGMGESADIIGAFVERGRKRALDMFITSLRYTNTVHRTLFTNKNLTLIGNQQDVTTWSSLAQQFRGTGIEFKDLNALAPGEFICISRRGIEKIRMPMATALARVAPKAKAVKRIHPTTFAQWDRAMRAIPTARLAALDDDVVALLGAVAGLNAQQMLAGARALGDELEARA